MAGRMVDFPLLPLAGAETLRGVAAGAAQAGLRLSSAEEDFPPLNKLQSDLGCEFTSVAGSELRRTSAGRLADGSDVGATGVGCRVRGLEAARTWPSY